MSDDDVTFSLGVDMFIIIVGQLPCSDTYELHPRVMGNYGIRVQFYVNLEPIIDDGIIIISHDIEVIVEASNGEEVLEFTPKKQVNVYVLDIVMPKLNGIETSGKLFELNPENKTIILTIHESKRLVKKALQNKLPENILYRKKQTFHLPIEKWIEQDLKSKFEELLDKKIIEKQGYFNYNYIEKIWRNFANSKLYYARQLWSLANFQIWHKLYIESEKIGRVL